MTSLWSKRAVRGREIGRTSAFGVEAVKATSRASMDVLMAVGVTQVMATGKHVAAAVTIVGLALTREPIAESASRIATRLIAAGRSATCSSPVTKAISTAIASHVRGQRGEAISKLGTAVRGPTAAITKIAVRHGGGPYCKYSGRHHCKGL